MKALLSQLSSLPRRFSPEFRRSMRLLAATALIPAGLLAIPAPVQALPMLPLPLAPGGCSQYAFNGNYSLKQSNGDTVIFSSIGAVASGNATAIGGINGPLHGVVTGGIQGDKLDFEITWNPDSSIGHYTGFVSSDGFAHGDTSDEYQPFGDVFGNVSPPYVAHWDSTVPLVCSAPIAPPAPPVPVEHQPVPPFTGQSASARFGVSVNGPTTLAAGSSGTYTAIISNPGDASAPVELFISFNGNLQQTGEVTAPDGFDCTVINYAGGTAAAHCTNPQFQSKATANITVQGRGSAPGAGQLVGNINSSDPAAQFVQKSQQLDVTIT